jgi:hypothetical protein
MIKLTAIVAVALAAAVLLIVALQRRAGRQANDGKQAVVTLTEEVRQLRADKEQLLNIIEKAEQKSGRSADTNAVQGWIRLGKEQEFQGMSSSNQQGDGATEPTVAGGLECHSLIRYPGRPELYAYFKIDPAFKETGSNAVVVEVEYFDADAGGHFRLDYDSFDESTRSLGAYTQSKEKTYLKGTQSWRKSRFLIDDGRFEGRENDQSDFRVTVVGGRFFLRSVRVMRAE